MIGKKKAQILLNNHEKHGNFVQRSHKKSYFTALRNRIFIALKMDFAAQKWLSCTCFPAFQII